MLTIFSLEFSLAAYSITEQPPLMSQLVNHAITCEFTERIVFF